MKTQEIPAENLLSIIEKRDREISELKQQIQWLLAQLRLSKHKQFGASSEQTVVDQLSLLNDSELTADLIAPEPEISQVKSHSRKRTRLTTDKLPENLPIEIIEHILPETECVCPDCCGKMHSMGTDVREEIKLIPAKALIKRHIRHIYSCRNCESTSDYVPMIKADMPEPVIKGGFASPEAIAHIATQKFMMASPLYRQEQEWKQNGIWLSRQTMSNWLIKASEDWLEPIYEEMKRRLCKHDVLHADESTLQVLKEPGKEAQSKSYMWLYRTSGEATNQIVLYEYQPDRKHIHPKNFLENFSGFIHSDGYEGYHKLPDNIIVIGCLAHARRKFCEALKIIPKDKQADSSAAKGVAYFDKLFYLEKQFSLLSHEKRRQERERLSKPIINELYSWIEHLNALPQTLLGKAVHYSQSQRKYLMGYLLDGRLEISNNRAERSMKTYVIGRKNWLFNNTQNGARASAIYYSIVVTAIENGLNPYEYLTWIFTHAPNIGRPGYVTEIGDFLPGSTKIPQNVYIPKPKGTEPEKYAWEED